ncbi:DUF4031 domain-containing protein [Nesterenkonia sp. F]|uniref:DUF4031 domain-containing protein n=1 Tax=Nesterenkonia sp. F TaxID=795955 RepID=UPI000255CAFC|nr:DUF4031 domain-containing protein [Nesterenkonia sp. F]
MTIYIDPPAWPAHGTLFSHLISDVSLDELHAAAERAGISPRAFDRDHYDVPAHRHDALVAHGAVPVPGSQLVRLLARSGLRVRSIERPEKVRGRLALAWERLLPAAPDLGEELLDRWAEPHRHYHSPTHLAAVLAAVARLQRAGELDAAPDGDAAARTVRLAVWFHDAVYEGAGAAGEDEEASAVLAEERLAPLLDAAEVAEVARLVRLTASHDPEDGDVAGAVLVDADLEVLGRVPTAYARYAEQVRRDVDHVSDDAFRRGRAAVLHRLLDRPRLYRTASGRELWEESARRNLREELQRLEG